MEKMLKEILSRIDQMDNKFDKRFEKVEKELTRFDHIENELKRFDHIENELKRFDHIEKELTRFDRIENQLDTLVLKVNDIQISQDKHFTDLQDDQREIRKEMAFYHGTLLKGQEEIRTEMRSNSKHFEEILDFHQGAIDSIAEKGKNKYRIEE